MADAIVVLNAGSSSIKFSLFLARGADLELRRPRPDRGPVHRAPLRRQGRATAPRRARSPGATARSLGHEAALRAPRRLPPQRSSRDDQPGRGRSSRRAWRARIRASRCASTPNVLARLREVRAARAAAPAAQPGADPRAAGAPRRICRRSPASTPRSTAPIRTSRSGSRSPRSCTMPACAATVSTACPTSTSRRCCRSTTRRRPRAGPSCCIWATARACAPSKAARASRARWASPRSTGCRWARACGTLDPGVILYLMDERKMDARAIEKLIYTQSGLLGVSGVSSDMRTLLASDDPRAKLAIDLYCYRIRRELGSLAARARRTRRDRVHRRDRRERGGDPRARVPRRALARRRARRGRERQRRAPRSARREAAWRSGRSRPTRS